MTDREFLLFLIGCPLAALGIWVFFFVLFSFGG